MTDEQIIKALDCCHSELGNMCSICPLFDPDNDYCEDELHKNALNLINRQKAEIERLKKENTILSKNADTAFQDGLDENRDLFKKEVEPEIRNEAIKEFAERLKRYSFVDNLSLNGKETVYVADIDNLVKEMTEASNR